MDLHGDVCMCQTDGYFKQIVEGRKEGMCMNSDINQTASCRLVSITHLRTGAQAADRFPPLVLLRDI